MCRSLSKASQLGPFLGKHLTIDNYRVDLPPEEKSRYLAVRGAYLRSYLKQTFDSPEYKKMTNVEKVEAAEEAIRQTGKDAHDQMGDQIISERLKRTKTASLPRTPPKAMAVCK